MRSATSTSRTALLPRFLIATATRALPRGVSRDRYRQEFAAELHELSRGQQLKYAGGVFAHIWALRVVLVKGVDSAHVPLLCRTNLHHHWRRYVNDERVTFELCARCGKEKDPIEQSNVADAGMAVGFGFGQVM